MNETVADGKKPKRPCAYCGILQSRLPRHLKRKHKEEAEVTAAMKLPKPEQDQAFNNIKKMGIFRANTHLCCVGTRVLHRERRCSSNKERPEGLVMCNDCKGFYAKGKIGKHRKTCSLNIISSGSVNFSRPVCNYNFISDDFRLDILHHFRNDEVGKLCQTDSVVVRLGQNLFNKSITKERRVIMCDMRMLGALVLKMREVAGSDQLNGEDVINREHFEELSLAVQEMTTAENGSMKAWLRLSIGYLLKKTAKVMKAHYIITSEMAKSDEVDRFLAVLDCNWDYIFYTAQVSCEQRRTNLRKTTDEPLEEDIVQLKEFISSEMRKFCTPGTYELFNAHSFVSLRNLLVARLTLFNERRGGEPARMTLKEWQDAINGVWIDPQLVVSVEDPLEQALINQFKLVYQSEKWSPRMVPVLVPNDTVEPIQLLVREREAAGIPENNVYLFPNTGHSFDHVNGWSSIKSVTKEIGPKLKKPQLLIADKFRQRASTLFALQDLDTATKETFYPHMGHSEATHTHGDQCPLALTELATVGGFLQGLDSVKTVMQTATCLVKHQSDHTLAEEAEPTARHVEPSVEDSPPAAEQPELDAEKPQPTIEYCDPYDEDPRATAKHTELHSENSQPDATHTNLIYENTQLAAGSQHRTYTRWSKKDTALVIGQFGSFTKQMAPGSTGSLPSVHQLKAFLNENSIFQGSKLSFKEKLRLLRTKIFNERKKFRCHFKSVSA